MQPHGAMGPITLYIKLRRSRHSRFPLLVLRFLYFVLVTNYAMVITALPLQCMIKVYIERNNLQLDLVRYRKQS